MKRYVLVVWFLPGVLTGVLLLLELLVHHSTWQFEWPEGPELIVASLILLASYLALLARALSERGRTEAQLRAQANELAQRAAEEEQARRAAEESLEQGIRERAILEERQRLARELHDSVSQAIYGVSLGINAALTSVGTDRKQTLEALQYSLDLAHSALVELRTLIFELRPEQLQLDGLVAALTRHAQALKVRYCVDVQVSACEEPRVSGLVKEALYRVGQEALQNAVRHSGADHVELNLRCEGEVLRLAVCDDGKGFNVNEEHPGHLGLKSIRERAASVGGVVTVESQPGAGTVVQFDVPLLAG